MERKLIPKTIGLLAAIGLLAGASTSALASIEFTATSGDRSAKAVFDIVGGNLQITLANIGSTPPTPPGGWNPTYILTALFFDINGVGALTPVSATESGLQGTVPSADVFGDYWQYKSGLSAPHAASEGIGTAGFSLFGPTGNFDNNTDGPNNSIDGFDYGLINFPRASGNDGIPTTTFAQSVVFTLSGVGLPTSLSASDISNVSFQYGTALSEPNLVPEPSTMIAGALLLLPFAASTARFFRRNRKA